MNTKMNRHERRRANSFGKFEANLTAVKIAACANCSTPNPQRLSHCAKCGLPAPEIEIREVSAVDVDLSHLPIATRFFLTLGLALAWVGAQLRKFANSLNQE